MRPVFFFNRFILLYTNFVGVLLDFFDDFCFICKRHLAVLIDNFAVYHGHADIAPVLASKSHNQAYCLIFNRKIDVW